MVVVVVVVVVTRQQRKTTTYYYHCSLSLSLVTATTITDIRSPVIYIRGEGTSTIPIYLIYFNLFIPYLWYMTGAFVVVVDIVPSQQSTNKCTTNECTTRTKRYFERIYMISITNDGVRLLLLLLVYNDNDDNVANHSFLPFAYLFIHLSLFLLRGKDRSNVRIVTSISIDEERIDRLSLSIVFYFFN